MPDTIPTYVTAERFDRYAARGLADEARDRREDLRIGYVELLSALRHLQDAGAWPSHMWELAREAHDTLTTRDHQLLKDIDAAGIHAEPIELSELDQLLRALTKEG